MFFEVYTVDIIIINMIAQRMLWTNILHNNGGY